MIRLVQDQNKAGVDHSLLVCFWATCDFMHLGCGLVVNLILWNRFVCVGVDLHTLIQVSYCPTIHVFVFIGITPSQKEMQF